jgi:hypothetical protein
MELHGQYVVLRPLRVDDAELTLGWREGDRATLLNRGATSVAEQAAWIASTLMRPTDEPSRLASSLETRTRSGDCPSQSRQ